MRKVIIGTIILLIGSLSFFLWKNREVINGWITRKQNIQEITEEQVYGAISDPTSESGEVDGDSVNLEEIGTGIISITNSDNVLGVTEDLNKKLKGYIEKYEALSEKYKKTEEKVTNVVNIVKGDTVCVVQCTTRE